MMKSNIDLTKNQIFSRQSFIIRGLDSTTFGTEFPWTFQCPGLDGKKFEAMRTGDRKEREHKKVCDEAVSRNYCDCCGTYLVNIPWNRTYGLCQRCSDDLDRGLRTYPWSRKY